VKQAAHYSTHFHAKIPVGLMHCFCWLLELQWKHDVGFGSKNIKL